MNMRRAGLMGLMGLILLLAGCATTGGGGSRPDPARMARVAKFAVASGTVLWLQGDENLKAKAHPEDRPHFIWARQQLRDLVASGTNFSTADIALALQRLPIKQLQGASGQILIGAALLLWDEYGSQLGTLGTNADFQTYVLPVAQGILAGLDQALGSERAEVRGAKAYADMEPPATLVRRAVPGTRAELEQPPGVVMRSPRPQRLEARVVGETAGGTKTVQLNWPGDATWNKGTWTGPTNLSYRVYWGEAQGAYTNMTVTTNLAALLPGFTLGKVYWFQVKSVAPIGVASDTGPETSLLAAVPSLIVTVEGADTLAGPWTAAGSWTNTTMGPRGFYRAAIVRQ